jgi:hypothetical protein
MRFSLYNVVASSEEARLIETLTKSGYAIRRLDTANVHSAEELWEVSAKQLGHCGANGWDGYADYVAEALLPNDHEGDKVAFLWLNSDAVLVSNLGVFLTAFDVFTTLARAAYAQGTEVIFFLVGEGMNYSCGVSSLEEAKPDHF